MCVMAFSCLWRYCARQEEEPGGGFVAREVVAVLHDFAWPQLGAGRDAPGFHRQKPENAR